MWHFLLVAGNENLSLQINHPFPLKPWILVNFILGFLCSLLPPFPILFIRAVMALGEGPQVWRLSGGWFLMFVSILTTTWWTFCLNTMPKGRVSWSPQALGEPSGHSLAALGICFLLCQTSASVPSSLRGCPYLSPLSTHIHCTQSCFERLGITKTTILYLLHC